MANSNPDSWTRARSILRTVLDEVDRMSDDSFQSGTCRNENRSQISRQRTQQEGSSGSRLTRTPPSSSVTGRGNQLESGASAFEEHRKIFGFKAPVSTQRGKHSRLRPRIVKAKKVTYTKDTVCLRCHDQSWLPSTEDRIQLAKVGLGFKKAIFDASGDSQHIHDVLTTLFPVLECCGGYTLLRLGENSRGLVPIDGPDGGITVPFLKDILRQAKLFVRPLQKDISIEEAKKFCVQPEEYTLEPEDFCLKCHQMFTLSQLRVHVESGCCTSMDTGNERSNEPIVKDEDTIADMSSNTSSTQLPSDSTIQCSNSGSPNQPTCSNPLIQLGSSSTYSNYISLISDSDDESIQWGEEQQIQCAIDASLQEVQTESECKTSKSSDIDAKTLLEKHRQEYLDSDRSNTYRVTVRRTHIWEDSINAFKHPYDTRKHLRVTFLGEPAVDEGGPRREFFMLVMNALSREESVLDGPVHKRVLRHNTTALDNKVFYIIGKIIVLSIIHGGSGPTFFAKPVLNYVFGRENIEAQVDDVPYIYVREKIQKLHDCKDEKQLRDMLDSDEYEFRFTCGVSQPGISIKLSDKASIVSALCRHYTLYSTAAELEQLRAGFTTLNFDKLLDEHPHVIQQLFQPSQKKITASFIQDFLEVEYSPKGSNMRETEEAIIMHWIRYLNEIESVAQSSTNTEDTVMPTLTDIFIFLTGCDTIPPLGFPGTDCAIEFDLRAACPTVSTCSLVLRFPLKMPSDYDTFKEKMDLYILGSQGFGQV